MYAQIIHKSFTNSRATVASLSALTIGSIAWYTHLYGTLPFIGKVHASGLADEGLHPAAYPWSHKGLFDSFDHSRFVHIHPWDQPLMSVLYCELAFGEATKSTAKFVLPAIRWIASLGATLWAFHIPWMKHERWQKPWNIQMVQMIKERCSNGLESFLTTCRHHTQTKRPPVRVMEVHYHPT
jgi:hypothetical protein